MNHLPLFEGITAHFVICVVLFQSSVEVEISRTSYVAINQNAFSKMRNAKFKEISKLVLSENTFEFENQSNIGRHGPVTTVSYTQDMQKLLLCQQFFLICFSSRSTTFIFLWFLDTHFFHHWQKSA